MRYVELRQPTDIEALLVWTYRDQQADRVIGKGMGLYAQEAAIDGKEVYNTSTDGVAAVERIGILGTRVDGGGPSAAALHPDAEYVHEAVMLLPMPVAMLMVQHAKASTRPDSGSIPTPRPVRSLTPNGRTKLAYAPWDKNHNYGWCPLEWTASPVAPDAITAEYGLWRRTLVILALALSKDGRMTRHRAMKPKAAEKPTLHFC